MPNVNPKPNQQIHKTIVSRDFSQQNLARFKTELGLTNWDNVFAQGDVDSWFRKLIDTGVDGLFADQPDRLVNLVRAKP
jgi:glycerophosphoryl diester phosphodiesterase